LKLKLLTTLLLVASLFGYLEWGTNNHAFLFEAEYDVLSKLFTDVKSVAHPLTFIPLIGQMLLLVSILQKKPHKYLIYSGIICLCVLLIFMAFIGLLGLNFKIFISTIPFISLSYLTVKELKKLNH